MRKKVILLLILVVLVLASLSVLSSAIYYHNFNISKKSLTGDNFTVNTEITKQNNDLIPAEIVGNSNIHEQAPNNMATSSIIEERENTLIFHPSLCREGEVRSFKKINEATFLFNGIKDNSCTFEFTTTKKTFGISDGLIRNYMCSILLSGGDIAIQRQYDGLPNLSFVDKYCKLSEELSPDLLISRIEIDPPLPHTYQQVVVRFTVFNVGESQGIVQGFHWNILPNNYTNSAVTIDPFRKDTCMGGKVLEPEKSCVHEEVIEFINNGEKQIVAEVFGGGEDKNPNNNKKIQNITVTASSQ